MNFPPSFLESVDDNSQNVQNIFTKLCFMKKIFANKGTKHFNDRVIYKGHKKTDLSPRKYLAIWDFITFFKKYFLLKHQLLSYN